VSIHSLRKLRFNSVKSSPLLLVLNKETQTTSYRAMRSSVIVDGTEQHQSNSKYADDLSLDEAVIPIAPSQRTATVSSNVEPSEDPNMRALVENLVEEDENAEPVRQLQNPPSFPPSPSYLRDSMHESNPFMTPLRTSVSPAFSHSHHVSAGSVSAQGHTRGHVRHISDSSIGRVEGVLDSPRTFVANQGLYEASRTSWGANPQISPDSSGQNYVATTRPLAQNFEQSYSLQGQRSSQSLRSNRTPSSPSFAVPETPALGQSGGLYGTNMTSSVTDSIGASPTLPFGYDQRIWGGSITARPFTPIMKPSPLELGKKLRET
jgi:hypothetical protein